MLHIHRFCSPQDALFGLTAQLLIHLSPFIVKPNPRIATTVASPRLALSGGETGKQLFNLWRTSCPEHPLWRKTRYYWIDERCVPPENEQSNFGTAERLFFNPLNIDSTLINPIHGENHPCEEARYYSQLAQSLRLPTKNRNAPALSPFHCAIVGIGADGHTASIFSLDSRPKQSALYYATRHPLTGQPRITASMHLLLNIPCIFIALIGEEKEEMLRGRFLCSSPLTPGEYLLKHHCNIHIFTTSPLFP